MAKARRGRSWYVSDYDVMIDEDNFLDAATELRWIRWWQHYGDIGARDRVIRSHVRFAATQASRFRRSDTTHGDLLNDAILGMYEAIDKYDLDSGVRFSTYAKFYIRDKQLATMRMISHSVSLASGAGRRAYYDAMRTLENMRKDREDVTLREVAEVVAKSAGIKVDSAESILWTIIRQEVSLDKPLLDSEGSKLADVIPSEECVDVDSILDKIDHDVEIADVRSILSELSDRTRYIIERRFLDDNGHDYKGFACTLEVLSNELGISRARIGQIEQRGVKYIKQRCQELRRERMAYRRESLEMA